MVYKSIKYPLLPSLHIIHCCPDNIQGWLTSFICSMLLKPPSKRNEYSSVLYIAPYLLLSTAGSTARVPTLTSLRFGFCKLFSSVAAKSLAGWWHQRSARSLLLLFPGRGSTGFQSLPAVRLLKAFCLSCEISPVNADTD